MRSVGDIGGRDTVQFAMPLANASRMSSSLMDCEGLIKSKVALVLFFPMRMAESTSGGAE